MCGVKHSCGKIHANKSWQARLKKPWTSTQKDEMDKEDPTQSIPDWLQPFTVDLEDLETHVLAHSSERENSDSEGDATKVERQKRKHNIHTDFTKKNERDLFHEQKSLMNW